MASLQFKRQLKQEAERWQQDGWISRQQYARIASHYQLDALGESAQGQFTRALISIGCVLIGISVITFVSANWQAIPRLVRVLMLVSLFLSVNIAGVRLLQRPQSQRLGQGLLLLGSLILGGNLALMGQMFHQSGSGYGLCLVWGAGTLAMAYGLSLPSLGVLAQLLVGVGYLLWLRDVPMAGIGASSGLDLVLQQMPLVTPAAFLPLAYRSRSRIIFALTALGTVAALLVKLGQFAAAGMPAGWAIALILTLPPALLWAYEDSLWRSNRSRAEPVHLFRPLSRIMAIAYLGLALYGTSFHWVWSNTGDLQQDSIDSIGAAIAMWPSTIVFAVLAVCGWVYLARPGRTGRWGLGSTDLALLGILSMMAGASFVHWHVLLLPTEATFLFNVLLAVLGIGVMREGLDDGDRSRFWYGLGLLVLQIFSRVLEYNTGLLVKSLTFLLCGVAVIVLGLWFERHVRPANRSLS